MLGGEAEEGCQWLAGRQTEGAAGVGGAGGGGEGRAAWARWVTCC